MTDFSESKLSKILARRIIDPEDRSQLLPLCTPVFCPDNNGVKASTVTIIDPSTNTFFNNGKEIIIGANFDQDVNPDLIKVGTPVIDNNGIYTGSSTNYVKTTLKNNEELILITNATVTTTQTLFTFAGNNVNAFKAGRLIKVRIIIDNSGNGQIEQYFADNPKKPITNDVTSPTNLNVNLIGAIIINLVESTLNRVPLFGPQVSQQPDNINNLIQINLDDKVETSYFVPYQVDLKTDEDLIDIIKADFAAKFKHAVSAKIFNMLVAMKTASTVPTINMGASLAETFGKALCEFIAKGTGQKFSVYRYDNGAPVVYDQPSNQPNIDKEIKPDNESFDSINDINVPALHYYNKPTLLFPETTFEEFQTGMCSGTLREYIVNKINVDTANESFATLGEAIFGSNDTFAVAFTQPSIKLIPDTKLYGYRLCCSMFYGIELIHKNNLRLFI